MTRSLSAVPPLGRGSHGDISGGACIMEAVSYVAGEPWSDHPQCACSVLGTFLCAWNDALSDDERDTLLRPLVLLLPGTRSTPAVIRHRSLMSVDWLIRVHTPAWLRLAGLQGQADALATLPEVTDMAQFPSMMPTLLAVRDAAAAAWDAAAVGAVAGNVVRTAVSASVVAVAAGNAAGAIDGSRVGIKAVSVVSLAAEDAAASVVAVAAGAGVKAAAAMAFLNPTRLELQQSALALVHRMIAVTEVTS